LVADGNGLYIRIRKKRSDVSRTWQFRRKERGELTITTLCTYPELSVKEARWIAQSAAAQLTAAVTGPPPLARSRILSDDEIQFVMTTAIRPGPVLRFLLLTGLRLGEAYNGHRDGQYWVVPAKASKNGREHRVWLSDLALASSTPIRGKARREAVHKEDADGHE
jgi:integrase